MSWHESLFRRSNGLTQAGFAAILLVLASCGFRPLYAPEEVATADPRLATVYVAQVPERLGQMLTIALRDGFNPGRARVDPRYSLHVTLVTQRRDTALRRDGTGTRAEIDVYANFQMLELESQKPVLSGRARSFGAIDLVEDEYANLVADMDTRQRAIQELALEIQTRVAGYLENTTTARR